MLPAQGHGTGAVSDSPAQSISWLQKDQKVGRAASAARAQTAITDARISRDFLALLSSAFAMAIARALERLRDWFMASCPFDHKQQ
ncbi:hypothetical protein ADU59_25565 [Pararhizobium polonicum]|uniref:Uncharacterized protein n=1 Tax=Pararhizobium polonicum TaxID=1612624 RepID=A0A1C7NUQ7_9HYPH|nr:hypothetical protein ADU59_25565 [Pararhizobium polonicum]